MDWFQVLGTRRTGGEPGNGLGNVAERQTWFAARGRFRTGRGGGLVARVVGQYAFAVRRLVTVCGVWVASAVATSTLLPAPAYATVGSCFTQVSVGVGYTCGIRTDGTVACWGRNNYGQSTPPGGTFSQVSAGWYHACGVGTDGTV